MLAYKFQGRFRTDALDGFEIIAPKQNTKVNELQVATLVSSISGEIERNLRTWDMSISNPSRAFFKLISLIGCFFASENVRCRYRIGVANVRVSISSEPAA